ncbi:MAG: dihydrodipicolinate synthase family protein, partial [Fimbriimonadaceae bacterium]
MTWRGVFPAITTPFTSDLRVDHDFLAKHINWMIESGCEGLVPLGSLGEAATLTHQEKRDILKTCVATCSGRIPVVAGTSGLSTDECVTLAKDAEQLG